MTIRRLATSEKLPHHHFAARGGTSRGSNDAISTEIVNQADAAADQAPAFPVTQENPEQE